jgi:DNA-binding transcriptional LysR family regulator
VNVIAGGFDLAIRLGLLDDSDLLSRQLGHHDMRLVASPDYLERAGTPQTVAEPANHRGILTRTDLDHWTIDNQSIRVPWHISTGNMLVTRDAVCAGLGIALLPEYLADASGDFPVRATSFISPPLCRTLKRLRSGPLGPHQPDGAHRMREIVQDWISPVRVKVDAHRTASVATASAAQLEDRNTSKETTFFDSIGQTRHFERLPSWSAAIQQSEVQSTLSYFGVAPKH